MAVFDRKGELLLETEGTAPSFMPAGDLPAAQSINDRIYPLTQVFYAQPFLDMHNRMKEALAILGRTDKACVRPPLVKITTDEIERIQHAIAKEHNYEIVDHNLVLYVRPLNKDGDN